MILLLIVIILSWRVFCTLAEMYFERDWPRRTWLGGAVSLSLLLLAVSAFGQQPARWDAPPLSTTPPYTPSGQLPPLLAVPNATISVCAYPASGNPCTNTITTYTDSTLGTSCPPNKQLMPAGETGLANCTATSDAQGNYGFWYNVTANPHVQYTVQSSWGNYGPYDILTPGAGVFCSLSGCTMTGPLNNTSASPSNWAGQINFGGGTLTGPLFAPCINGICNANLASGADIGAKVTNLFTSLSSGGTVFIPAGNYSFSTTMAITLASNVRDYLVCDPGAVLNYTGSTNALLVSGSPALQYADFATDGCTFDGTSSTGSANGIVYQNFYGILQLNTTTRNFTSGAGVLFNGAGTASLLYPKSHNNKYGFKLVGYGGANPTAANNIHVYGGHSEHNSSWGWYDDYSDYTATGQSQDNSIDGMDFSGNGTASTATGQVYIEACQGCSISHSYFEDLIGNDMIDIGNASAPNGSWVTTISQNQIQNGAGVNGVNLINAYFANIKNNVYDSGCLANGGAISSNISVIGNVAVSGGPQTCGTNTDFLSVNNSPIQAPWFAAPSGTAVSTHAGSGSSNSFIAIDPTNSFNAFAVDAAGNGIFHGSSVSTSGSVAYVGAGVPGISCNTADTYRNTSASSSGTVLYRCYPANTWVPLVNSPIRAGTWSISSSTTASITFASPFASTPTSCSVTTSASAAATGTPFATSLTTTGFTVNVPTNGTIAGTYQCVLNNSY